MAKKELVAASSRPILLSILAEGDNYGYGIILRVRELSEGSLKWTDGMLYPVLHRLEKEGLVVSEWKKLESGRRRKYYRLNPKGEAALENERGEWQNVNRTLERLWSASLTMNPGRLAGKNATQSLSTI